MKGPIAWFASNGVAANLLMAMLVAGGLTATCQITQKTFPDIDIEVVTVSVDYLGAAPEEVEEGVCIRIEEQVDGVDGIDELSSVAREGNCTVIAELLSGADVNEVLDEIKNRVDSIDTFPVETEKPLIEQFSLRRGVADLAISGDLDERALKALAERVRDEVLALPGVTQAEVTLVRPFEISVEVPEETLRRHGLRFDEVVAAVQRSSLDMPGGSVKTDGGEILLRTKGQAYRGADFERIVVLTRPDGTRVTLGEVASVIDGFEDVDLAARFDAQPAAVVQVYRVGDQDVVEISEQLHGYLERARATLPEGVSITLWQDDSEVLRARLDTLLRNGRSGFLLVLAVLALFLRFRVAVWVTVGVPIAMLGALGLFEPLGQSIDVMSLFAFIVVLGILVDDAVVVGENIYSHQQQGESRLQGAIAGAQNVSVPVIFGVLTTVAAFLPLLMVPGPMGQVFSVLATVVIACLAFSLIESQLVLPAHLAHGRDRPGRVARSPFQRRWKRVQAFFGSALERLAAGPYRALLEQALRWRYATIATAVALLLLTVGVIASGRMHFSFFPPVEADYLAAWLTMPQGTPFEVTEEAAQQLEDSVAALRAAVDPEFARPGESLVEHVLASVGAQPFRDRQSQGPTGFGRRVAGGAHLAEVVLELTPSEQRAISTSDVANRWREIVGEIPGAVELVFASDLFSAGQPIYVRLQGADTGALRAAAARLKQELAAYPGVIDIADSFRAGKQELKLRIEPSAEQLGLTMHDLARQMRQAFYGEEAQRIQRGRDDVRVMVRYPEAQRRSLGDVENVRIRAPDGTEVPFGTVAQAELGRGFATIRRADRMRVVNVTANVDRNLTTANDVLRDLQKRALPPILADYPSVSYSLEGEQREQRRAFAGLGRAYVLALLAIFALLAVPLRSYAQPLIIMSVIPFGLVGAIGGHLLMGKGLSFMSVVGIVALSGVVVNASLVLVHAVNGRRERGLRLHSAVVESGIARFRPIVLTSLTTFAGLTPLMLERSVQAQFLIPMAISLAFGVLFATTITLLVVPCGYLVLEDLRGLRGGGEPERAPLAVVPDAAATPPAAPPRR
ncbi:MAG: efflux RND transporter permease subunit [Myxococcota bacterium]|nr:efflux RND transporter permease subunit [Myxococcota bacterium]